MKSKALVVLGNKSQTVHFLEEAIAKYPWAVNPLLQSVASLFSPFDHTLRLQLKCWEIRLCELRIPKSRRLRDQSNRLHPAVISAFGERAAFFLIHRNYPFWRYSATLIEVQTVYENDGVGAASAKCELSASDEYQTTNLLRVKGSVLLNLKSEIHFLKDRRLAARVRTSWRLEKRVWAWEKWKR